MCLWEGSKYVVVGEVGMRTLVCGNAEGRTNRPWRRTGMYFGEEKSCAFEVERPNCEAAETDVVPSAVVGHRGKI